MSQPYRGGARRFNGPRRHPHFRSASIDRSKYIKAAEPVTPVSESVPSQLSFADFGLAPEVLQNITDHGYESPLPIQEQSIPLLMEGRDVVGLANTGTGKTAAFLLPAIHKVFQDHDQGVLIVAPTRELAVQIFDECHAFIKGLKIGTALCIGGKNIETQIRSLANNPHFVIGTPGRLKDVINRGAFKPHLYTTIVLDEVDRMLDIGFRKDILFLISKLPAERQSACFSATINNDIEEVMRKLLNNPARVSVKTQETSLTIEQDVVKIRPGENKIEVLYNLLQQPEFEKVIVFGRTKHGINKLEQQLTQWGLNVCALHGNKSQSARQASLRMFKQGAVQALLATDIAARGIDVQGITHVINFDEPESYSDYVHRIGRTGRAGQSGKALTFVV